MATARGVLERGAAVVIFPEGTRIRKGPLRRPKRGVGRLALETGAPVIPVAILGSDRARPARRQRARGVGRSPPVWSPCHREKPLRFPRVEQPSPRLAQGVTARLWP